MLQSPTAAAGLFESLVNPGPLTEAHADLESDCNQCHSPFEKSRQDDMCFACHEDVQNDIFARRGFHGRIPDLSITACKHCHTDHKGREFDIVGLDLDTFDHGMTDYILRGAHLKINCVACHARNDKYREAASRCVDCHESDEPHKGRLGTKCGNCHNDNSWQEAKFDHDRTDFPLRGEHREARCDQCHANERYEDTSTACASCHALDDIHGGRYGNRCDACHSPSGWQKLAFDHDTETDFPLKGKHRDVTCAACHSREFRDDTRGTTCYACHEFDDSHQGTLGKQCERCHNEHAWGEKVFFEHDLTRFPLIGVHAVVSCEQCHVSAMFKDTSGDCVDCHKRDDLHGARLGPACGRCHNPNGWALWNFDHNKQTDYVLDGGHEGLDCLGCHQLPVKDEIDQSTACIACHRDDDVHRGKFGARCEQCHVTESFGQVEFR